MELVVGNAEILNPYEYILNSQGIDLIASNTDLALMEISIVNIMCRETVLKRITDLYKDNYNYIIIDTLPSLGILTINVFATADSIIIPIEADDYFSARAMEALLKTISKVRKQINPKLVIEGVLITKMDKRKSYKDVIYSSIKESYGKFIRIFETQIPTYAQTSKMAQYGQTAITYDAKSKIANGYNSLADEILGGGQIG
jgi:chromosome partitioning protein